MRQDAGMVLQDTIGCSCEGVRSQVNRTASATNTLRSELVQKYYACMSAATFQSSELQRGASKVFEEAEEHPVRIERRGEETMVLMTESERESERQLLQFAAQIIAATTDEEGTLSERLSRQFHWMLALGDEDRALAASDIVRAARASFSTGQAYLAVAEISSWHDTAELIAAGKHFDHVEWLDAPIEVERP